jgi:nucleotide-binding universal stress UspA family protein
MLTLKKILVATDFSLPSLHALRYALDLRQLADAGIVLLHVVESAPSLAFLRSAEVQEKARQWADEQLRHMSEHEVPRTIKIELLRREGTGWVEITRTAKEIGADLIVMATTGRTGLKHAAIGSTAERVVRHAPCPVLTIRAGIDEEKFDEG